MIVERGVWTLACLAMSETVVYGLANKQSQPHPIPQHGFDRSRGWVINRPELIENQRLLPLTRLDFRSDGAGIGTVHPVEAQ